MSKLVFELVLPCYNESKSLGAIVERSVFAARAAGHTAETFQLTLVENGSRDDSLIVLTKLKAGALGHWFRFVSVAVNQGYGFGLWAGLQTTTAPVVGWSHADQQCDPADAFRALKLLHDKDGGKILVKGIRSGRNWKDIFVSRVFDFFAQVLLGFPAHEINAQPKIFGRSLLSEITDPPKDFSFDLYVLYRARKAAYAEKTLPVIFLPRAHGLSNWASTFFGRYQTILKMIRYMYRLAITEGRL